MVHTTEPAFLHPQGSFINASWNVGQNVAESEGEITGDHAHGHMPIFDSINIWP